MSSFEESVAQFKEVTAKELSEKLANNEDLVAFIGRPTCPFCQRFVPKLANVVKQESIAVYYLNSGNLEDQSEIMALRNKYDVPTVPGLLVSKAGETKVVCDSSVTEPFISSFIKG